MNRLMIDRQDDAAIPDPVAILDLIDGIAKRPAMYVGTASLASVSTYLAGFDHAVVHLGHPSPLAGWGAWLSNRFEICHSAWSWARILLYAYGTDAAAIEALPGLFRECLRDRAVLGADGIHRKMQETLMARFGRDWNAPEHTSTQDPGE